MGVELRTKRKETLFLWLGMIIVFATCIPFFIMGEGSVITYHDQLDGEIITYILNAKHLFSTQTTYPELMNGIPKAGMVSPAVLFIPLYRLFPAFTAFMITKVVSMLVGYVFMYLLIKELTGGKTVAYLTALAFALLPFYPVYGFCIIGQPMLWYALLCLHRNKNRAITNYILLALYALGSSLALVGFSCVMAAVILCIYEFCKRNQSKWRILIATMCLTGTYAITNISLIVQLFADKTQDISHKSEVVLQALPCGKHIMDVFLFGVNYAESNQIFIIPIGIIAVAITLFRHNKSEKASKLLRYMGILFGTLLTISVLCGLYQSSWMVEIRNRAVGVFHEFNAERIAWMMPVMWYALLGIAVSLLWDAFAKKIGVIIKTIVAIGMCALMLFGVYQSDTKTTVMKMLKGDEYHAITWEQFFAGDLFREIAKDIGLPQEEYRVVSFGIYPSAAAYNGFYCLDAYSNNYSCNYKHQFREIIAPELDKSEYLRLNFDNWGNRCYITSAESMDYYTFERRWTPVTQSLELNANQLKEMGCKYLISASYLIHPEQAGVTLLREQPYENENSWYRLYLYEVN